MVTRLGPEVNWHNMVKTEDICIVFFEYQRQKVHFWLGIHTLLHIVVGWII